MAYYLSLCSPETYEAFSASDRTIDGFRERHANAASRVEVGDKFVFYVTKLSRWCGLFSVESPSYRDTTPRYTAVDDPYVIRFRVRPIVWLDLEKAVPIQDPAVWSALSFTRDHSPSSSQWTGKVRTSLNRLEDSDGQYLERILLEQSSGGREYPLDRVSYRKEFRPQVRAAEGLVPVSVPDADTEREDTPEQEVRESVRIQALLARIGTEMGMQIWIPRNDRGAVSKEWPGLSESLLSSLPLNYDEATIRTIEQIDVLWVKRRAIVRAFEVEHTTSIYSGILRMADLMALQPNLNIRAHIVAPAERRNKVFQELQRPVFSLLEPRPLSDVCTYLSYEGVRELSSERHLAHMAEAVVEEFAEEPE